MTDTKQKILAAAEELIAQKGMKNTTISAISKKAGVVDSHAYKFFKNKEELLFQIAFNRFGDALSLFEEHLLGITDTWALLQKMIWYNLNYNDKHPGYVRLLLFECRSNKNYYQSDAYRLMKKHAGFLVEVLKKGMDEGEFRNDIETGLIRDIIYGTYDFEAISALAIKEIDSTSDDLEDIMTILKTMLSPPTEKKNRATRKKKILEAAEEEFAAHGYENAKISNISKKAGVSDVTVYDYFRNKENLLMSIPSKRFESHLKALPEAFETKTPLEKLKKLLRYHFLLYLPNRKFLKVFLLDVQLNARFYASTAFKNFQKYYLEIEKIIAEGQKEGSFRSDINPRIFRSMFLGAFNHIALRWIMIEKPGDVDKTKEIDAIVDLFSNAVLTNQSV